MLRTHVHSTCPRFGLSSGHGAGGHQLKRRDVIAGLAATAVPSRSVAQPYPGRLRRIGILMGAQEPEDPGGQERIEAALSQLRELGWEKGRNLETDIRWAGGDLARINNHAEELVSSG